MHKKLHLHALMDNLILNPICNHFLLIVVVNRYLPFYSEPRCYLDKHAEKNYYARIDDSGHNSYFSPRVTGARTPPTQTPTHQLVMVAMEY